MSHIKHRKYLLEFDVWEPQEKLVDKQMQEAIYSILSTLRHAANIKITPVSEEVTK